MYAYIFEILTIVYTFYVYTICNQPLQILDHEYAGLGYSILLFPNDEHRNLLAPVLYIWVIHLVKRRQLS